MSSVIFDMSMSLDGFVAASNISAEEPLGVGGEQLHEWAMNSDDERDRAALARAGSFGAMIAGRTTYDASVPWWGPDGPTGPARVPLVVVTHEAPSDSPEGGVYHFISGITEALAKARALAGDKDIAVMGGPDIGRQFLKQGLLDEIGVHVVPVLFGSGTPLFEHLGGEHIQLELVETISTRRATHLRYRVVK